MENEKFIIQIDTDCLFNNITLHKKVKYFIENVSHLRISLISFNRMDDDMKELKEIKNLLLKFN
jgi:hypothetical protein